MAGYGSHNIGPRPRQRVLSALQLLLSALVMIATAWALQWVMAAPARIVWAWLGGGWVLLAGSVLVALKIKLSPRRILKKLRASPLNAHVAPGLNELLKELAHRARLPATPLLYHIPSTTVNAFVVGTRQASAVAITDAMLRSFSPREIAGVFAHELSHVRNNDLWLMAFAALFSRLTHLLSLAGQILLLINLPLMIFTAHALSWATILILAFLALMSTLIQFSLSRSHEYNADRGAVELTDDPCGLVMALDQMERHHRQLSEQIRRLRGSRLKRHWLQGHPLTAKRIERLHRLEPITAPRPYPHGSATVVRQAHSAAIKQHAPEQVSGLGF